MQKVKWGRAFLKELEIGVAYCHCIVKHYLLRVSKGKMCVCVCFVWKEDTHTATHFHFKLFSNEPYVAWSIKTVGCLFKSMYFAGLLYRGRFLMPSRVLKKNKKSNLQLHLKIHSNDLSINVFLGPASPFVSLFWLENPIPACWWKSQITIKI